MYGFVNLPVGRTEGKMIMKKALSLVLVLVMLIGLLPQMGMTTYANEPGHSLAGKKISILGDSISTMEGVSNNTDYNSTIGGNHIYYSGTKNGVTLADTWWQQAIDTLGMELCVSNAWSGSCIFDPTPKASTAYVDRCVQLHNDNTGEEPDIIAVYLGTNDISKNKDALGNASDIDYDALILEGANGYTYKTPTTASEAYAIMLHKITQRYPKAEVYCFTLVHKNTFNEPIRAIAEHFGANVVDLFQNSGIITGTKYDAYYIVDGHPNVYGMDAITNCFLSSVYENSQYVSADTHSITYNLSNVWVDQGKAYSVLDGNAFACSFTASNGIYPEVTVTMGGEDITAACYAEGKITIAQVTGDLAIQAKAHYHSYVSVITPPACAEQGYTTYTCGCGYSYVDHYVAATEKHDFVNNVCSACGLDGFALHEQNGAKTYYKTLEEALAVATDGTIKLLADATVETVALKPGVTLDLNGHTLTADAVVAMEGALVTDGDCVGGGLLKIAKEKLALDKDNGNVIAVWNGVDGYVLTKVIFQQLGRYVDTGVAQYIFLPNFSNAEAVAFLADGGTDNGLEIQVHLTWNAGHSQQFYTYSDDLIKQVFDGTGRWAFNLTVRGIANITDMVANSVIVTDSGAKGTGDSVKLEGRVFPASLQGQLGYGELPEG